MVERREEGSGSGFLGRERTVAAVAILLVVASFWNSAVAEARILILWAIALAALGRWGERRTSPAQNALLGALAGVGLVHLVVAPGAGFPPAAQLIRIAALTAAIAAWAKSTGGAREERARASGETGRIERIFFSRPIFLVGLAGSLLTALFYALHFSAFRESPGAAVARMLSPAAYAAVFAGLGRMFLEPTAKRAARRILFVAPAAILALGAVRTGLMLRAQHRSERLFAKGDLQAALEWNRKALDLERALGFRAAANRLLLERARILDGLDRPAEALDTVLRRARARYLPPSEPLLRSLCDAYLTTSPLEEQIAALSHPLYLWRFDKVPLPEEKGERSLLLGLFARCGLLDRLLIEYAQNGLSHPLDFAYLQKSLAAARENSDPLQSVWRDYLLGVCEARLGENEAAAKRFRSVLERLPRYHNAIVWLERLGRPPAATARENSGTTGAVRTAGVIENAWMLGNHRWGLNVDDALWTALEMRPGRYELRFEVAGKAAAGDWPILSVYLDGVLVLDRPIRSARWTFVNLDKRFVGDTCHKLVVGFANDIYRRVNGRIVNRNLYLRRVVIVKLGRDKKGPKQ